MTAADATVPSSQNDNSNPQQGSGLTTTTQDGSRTPTKPTNEAATARSVNTMRSPPSKKDSRKLFVGGLPADVTANEFLEYFEQFGEVVDSVVMFDRDTHRSRGFGFVTFLDAEVANRLLKTGRTEEGNGDGTAEDADAPLVGRLVMRGKTCEVKAAEPKESSRSYRRNYQNNQSGFQNQGGGSSAAGQFGDKPYNSTAPVGDRQPIVQQHHAAPYPDHHSHHYMAGHHHHPAYYPAYHPGMYLGVAAGFNPAPPMYSPMAHGAPAAVPDGHPLPHHPQPYVPQVVTTHVEGAPHGSFMQTPHNAAGHPYAYGHHPAHMMPYMYHARAHPSTPQQYQTPYPVPGSASSVMQPAAPGLPHKEE